MALTRITTATIVLTFSAAFAHAQSAASGLTPLQTAVACAPPAAFAASPVGRPQIIGGQDVVPRTQFGVGDLLVVSGGMKGNLEVGQRYFVRRPMFFPHLPMGKLPIAETLGWVRMVAINQDSAIATVDVSCESIGVGDYLEPFVAPEVPAGADRIDTSGTPDFTAASQVIFGKERSRIAGTGDFVLIDHGATDGLTAGTRVAVYRDFGVATLPLTSIGEGMVISTAETTALVRIATSRSSVETGDYIVPRKP